MTNDNWIDDFFLEGGDELMNTEECPHCGHVFYLEQRLEWIDKIKNICKCPNCGEEIVIL